MKTLHALLLIVGAAFCPAVVLADPCTLSDDLIELNSVSASGGNCIVNIKYSFTLKKNNGSKFAYVHFWLTPDYSGHDYGKGPDEDDLGDVLATIAISTASPITLLPDYAPDDNITPIFAGLTVSETDLGGGNFRISIDNIQLLVPNACTELPEIVADVWATQSNDKETPPVHCVLKGGNVKLPVTLARFNGTLLDNAISLSWTTTEQTGSRHFDVERSADAREFAQVGRVEVRGDSRVAQRYQFTDATPLPGMNYYRLRVADLDGTSEISRLVAVDNAAGSVAFELLGNPASSREIRFLLKNEDASAIRLYDLSGRAVRFSLNRSGNEFVLKPGNQLPAGLYVLSLRGMNAGARAKRVLVP
ncbi:Por secretion system C-terminal sorting domain-containing protein [Dyadobacter soli]|uniref:Por secretion system C-terminal sorting domain-containing protein n=1 Tax=Dyadobacter soli TaxID=659014 RepID=A0A1G7FZT1_9BACT|nr:T9SS type A sorting domain-containing protein [Dyadobacter soli]SDE81383.1 Por secretion system C-terminal sorting domain-containing protein [Dyadobacter soli]